MLTTILDLLGAVLLVAFALVVWWPSALLVGAVLLLLASWRIEGGKVRPRRRIRREGAS